MSFLRKKIFVLFLTTVALSGCNPDILKYQLDPGIDQLNGLAENAKIVALSVKDNRPVSSNQSSSIKSILGPNDEANVLRGKLVALLKQGGYKIINNPLLADISFEIQINKLELNIESSTFKSTIRGNSEFKFSVRKNGEDWAKVYRATREQEVANPVNELDATGVMNQMLTRLLSNAFSDASLKEFIQKNQL